MLTIVSGLIISIHLKTEIIQSPDKIIEEIPAVFLGEILKINKKTDKYIRCIAVGLLDAKILPEQKDTKISLIITGVDNQNKSFKTGDKIFANCYIRLPQKKQLPTDFPEDIYYFSQDIQWISRANAKNVAVIKHSKNINYYHEIILEKIDGIIKNSYDETIVGIVKAITTGDKSDLQKEHRDYFSYTGTAHILAVSGLHVGLIASIVYVLLGFIYNRWVKLAFFSIIVINFIYFTSYQPSAIRAGFMAILIMFINVRERNINLINVVSFIILIAILVNPKMIYSIAFQMSSISVLGIAFLYRPIYEKLSLINTKYNTFLRYILNALSVSLSASLAVSPLVAYYFQVYSYFSPLINLIIIPLMSLGYIWNIASITFNTFIPLIGDLFAKSAELCIFLSLHINQAFYSLDFMYNTSENAMYISIFISLTLIYLFFSKSIRMLVFRAVVCIIISVGFFGLSQFDSPIQNMLIVKDKYTAIISKKGEEVTNVVIADRRLEQYPTKDLSMINYIKKIKGQVHFFYTGEVSKIIAEELRAIPNIRFSPLSNKELNFISDKFKLKKLPQIIEFENFNE